MSTENTDRLRRVVYRSRQVGGLDPGVIVDEIALPAMRKNRSLFITGCLWFDRSSFIQILEGPDQAVADMYARILNDARHTDVETLLEDSPECRQFERFSMRTVTGGMSSPISSTLEFKPNGDAESEFRPILSELVEYLGSIESVGQ